MKKETLVDEDALLNYKNIFSNDFDSYLKELSQLNNDQIPHFSEEAISSIFTLKQQVVELQTKLAKYIKSQQNIIRLNFFIKEDKVFESYVNITFEIKKMILLLKRYKSKFSKLEKELILRLLSIRKYNREYDDFINKHEDADESIFNRKNIITNQYNMMREIFSVQISHQKEINNAIESYYELYYIYSNCADIYCDTNIKNNITKIRKINNLLKNRKYSIDRSSVFTERKLNFLLNKYFTDVVLVQEISDVILNEERLKKFSIWLSIKYLYSSSYHIHKSESMEDDLVTTLLDTDTINFQTKKMDNKKNNFLNLSFPYSKNYICELYRHCFYETNIEELMKIIYAEFLKKMVQRENFFTLFDSREITIVFKMIIKILYEKNYNIDLRELTENTKQFINMMDDGYDNKYFNKSIDSILKDLYEKSTIRNMYQFAQKENLINDTLVKTYFLEYSFRDLSDLSEMKYNDGSLWKNYVACSTLVSNNENPINLKFYLTHDIVRGLFLIFQTGYLVEKDFTANLLTFDQEFFKSLFDEVAEISKNKNMPFNICINRFNDLKKIKSLKYLDENYWLMGNTEYFKTHKYDDSGLSTVDNELTLNFLHQLMKEKVKEIIKTYSDRDSKVLCK